jgi:hypothetical protein
MRPSGLTAVASTNNKPAPEIAKELKWVKCQSVALPFSAEYWHIGEIMMRFASVCVPMFNGEKRIEAVIGLFI